jgi:superfamily II DNA helicase RecQ
MKDQVDSLKANVACYINSSQSTEEHNHIQKIYNIK